MRSARMRGTVPTARRITTRIRLPRGAAVYDVTGGGGRLTPRAEGGEAAIRVRLADDEPDGRWTAVIKDLTSGLRSETAFEVKRKGLKTK